MLMPSMRLPSGAPGSPVPLASICAQISPRRSGLRSSAPSPDWAPDPPSGEVPNRLELASTWLQKSASPVEPSGGCTSLTALSSLTATAVESTGAKASASSAASKSTGACSGASAVGSAMSGLSSPASTMTRSNPAVSAPISAPTAPATAASRHPGLVAPAPRFEDSRCSGPDAGCTAGSSDAASTRCCGWGEADVTPPVAASGTADAAASGGADVAVRDSEGSAAGRSVSAISERQAARQRSPTGNRRSHGTGPCPFLPHRPSRRAGTDSAHPLR